MPTHWYKGKIKDIKNISTTTKHFEVEIIETDAVFDFIPGQFVTMDLPVGEKRLARWRSYSIANRPGQNNVLEFCIVKSESGLATEYLFDVAKIGAELKFKGPDGGFVIPPDLSQEIIMICTGTGVAPFRSMIHHIIEHKIPFKGIHLIFGTRKAENILYQEEFDKIASLHNHFKYSIALSREELQGYHHGYVHEIYMEKYTEVQEDRQFYICGWSHMIDDAVANILIKLKYKKSQIHYELYG